MTKLDDIQEGRELIYGGGPVVGGWFTICCRVKILRIGRGRVKVIHVDGGTPGKICWVTRGHLSLPLTTSNAPSTELAD
jgi:hypothetical protein